jgi:hypothetical protein
MRSEGLPRHPAVAYLFLVRLMRLLAPLLLFAVAHALSFATSDDMMPLDEAVQKRLLLVAAKPKWPDEASHGARYRTSTGLFELKFDYETGHLREIHVVRSTGNRILDAHTIGSFRVWQAKPRSIHNLLVPVAFKPLGVF